MKYGYARVSTQEQNLARQLKQLKEYGCEYIFEEKTSGATTDRPELQRMMESLQIDDVIVVTDLTRISRSTQDLFKLIETIKEKGASIKSIKDTWLDTTSDNPYSTFLLTVMAGVNQLERDLIKMRQKEGIAIAKEQGKYNGRPKQFSHKNAKVKHAIELYEQGNKTVNEICKITGLTRSTFYLRLKEYQNDAE
ncbi:recombinase family protein [Bacillus pseudomycoides]|uniref:recombinase family protein n=1 Tax=Bacillus pseudomycoides TaxID=64104 RepID=UPI000BF04E94|nr:recombinase family protein [Bacillus pseudomycoides]PEM69267.1 resolvase [Bacillus pseudomycoides]PGA60192.1 resolvase [Bacillus pseudomycoides]PHA65477.1 resolvase [Bacillus pseudomycoides]